MDGGYAGGKLRLIIVDHHQLFRDCLASALVEQGRFDVVGKVSSGPEALDRLARTQADLLLVVLGATVDGVPDLIGGVAERFAPAKVVLLGHDETEDEVLSCLEAGASGYLARDQSLPELCSALEAVARGETVCTPGVAHSLFARLARLGGERRRRDRLDYLTLTARELEILHLVGDGLNNQEIASRLFLSVHTVKNHVHKILETLGVHSRWDAVRYAVEHGWIRGRRQR
ncbi:MAG TPA: response regulator transcription factor [Thermoanaerobaculia bacterium]|nr:response regulator transcription factor [Thermoanaerobaculia bacterium]